MTMEQTSYTLTIYPIQQFHGNVISQLPVPAAVCAFPTLKDSVPLGPSATINPFFLILVVVLYHSNRK